MTLHHGTDDETQTTLFGDTHFCNKLSHQIEGPVSNTASNVVLMMKHVVDLKIFLFRIFDNVQKAIHCFSINFNPFLAVIIINVWDWYPATSGHTLQTPHNFF